MLSPAVASVCALTILSLAEALACAQGSVLAASQSTLRQQYIDAQKAQQRNDLAAAAVGYRGFLSHAQAELAEAYMLAGDYPHALERMDDALALSRENELLLQAARVYLLAGNMDHAGVLATSLIQAGSAPKEILAGAHQVLGRVRLKQQRDQEARKEFEQATELDPTFLNGYDLAVACLDLGDETCATQVFGEMEHSFGDKAELHVAFGKAYGNSDFQPRAITEFRRAIAEDPRLPGTHYLLAAVLLANGGDESARVSAEHELMEELQLSPHDSLTYSTLGQIALIQKDYPRAEEFLQKAILYGAQLPEGYLYLGQVYFNTGKMTQAEEALRNCVRLTRDVSRNRYQVQKAHYLLGRILSQRGQQEEAHAELQLSRDLADKTLALDKSRLAGVMDTAHESAVQVEMPDAAETTEAAAQPHDPHALQNAQSLEKELRPVLADGYNNLGALAATRNDFAEATSDFRHAAVWDPKLDGLDYNWGRAAFAGNQYAEAVGPLSRYVAAHGDDMGARSVLAISEFQTGNYQACIDALRPTDGKTELAQQVQYIYAEALVKTRRFNEGIDRLTALAKANPGVGEIQSALVEARALQGASRR